MRLNQAAQPTIEFTAPEESTITSLAVIETASAAQKKAGAEEAEKCAKNRAHQGVIHREIVEALEKLGLPEDGAKRIIEAIVQGRVPHVTIEY